MKYAVDFVLNVMKGLSSSEPVLFQRDGTLFVVSQEGFGQVSYGLRTSPERIESWQKREQSPEILESEDILQHSGDEVHKTKSFRKKDRPYLEAICFGPDANLFTLEGLSETARKMAKLPDDKRIRMVSHDSNYHSHKYGYACDGIDVSVAAARVMNRDRYLELIRDRETKIIEAIESLGNAKIRGEVERAYQKSDFPDCIIMTPYIMINLPRKGVLDMHGSGQGSWNQRTSLGHNTRMSRGGILAYYEIDTSCESPFGVVIKLNAQTLETARDCDEGLARIAKEVGIVNSNRSAAEDFISRLNEAHNNVEPDAIRRRKERLKKTG